MSVPARISPEPSDGVSRVARLGDAFVWPAPPLPVEGEEPAETVSIDILLPLTSDDVTRERLTAAAKLSAVVVLAGLGSGFAMWAFGSAAVRAVMGLFS